MGGNLQHPSKKIALELLYFNRRICSKGSQKDYKKHILSYRLIQIASKIDHRSPTVIFKEVNHCPERHQVKQRHKKKIIHRKKLS